MPSPCFWRHMLQLQGAKRMHVLGRARAIARHTPQWTTCHQPCKHSGCAT